ncbi:hypothetical protein ES708_11902 [subsurface metagenome]
MSVEIVKKQIEEFLATDTPEVLAIRGAWGVGKTYAWNKFFKEAKDKKRIALEQYSYVSLFGINSLDSLKYAIYEQSKSKELIGKDTTSKILDSKIDKKLTALFRTKSKYLKFIPGAKNVYPELEEILFSSLNKFIVCIHYCPVISQINSIG